MVKVITIMDDVYSELYKIKKAKGMSFTGAIRYLIKEREKEGKNIITFAGSVEDADINKRDLENLRKGKGSEWRRI